MSLSPEQRLDAIERRNRQKEAEKAWEVSLFRRSLVTVVTYLVASVTLWTIGSSRPLLEALIPTLGYILSVQSIPMIKKWWIDTMK